MIRRALLLSVAVVGAVLAQAPAAHADVICMVTVTLEGAIDWSHQECFDYDHNQACAGGAYGPPLQTVEYRLCVPDPQFV